MSLKQKIRKLKSKSPTEAAKYVATQPVAFRVKFLKKRPPEVIENQLLFYSSEDYSDNPRALFDYLIKNNYNEKYNIVWLVRDYRKYKHINIPNVQFVPLVHPHLGIYTYKARYAALSSKYLFYSHSLNWSNPVRMNQVFVDLWHGCGYKGQKKGIERKLFFDYCFVPSEAFVPAKMNFFSCPRRKLLPLGYPRYDWFKTDDSFAAEFISLMLASHSADKFVVWMPTFRQSTSTSLGEGEITEGTGLPIIADEDSLKRLDELCSELGVVLLLKRHFLQLEYGFANKDYENIIFVGKEDLDANDINLYELLAHSDALITDYSSVAVDYLLLDKPIGFMLDDYEKYEYERGWSFDDPLSYMPGHHLYSFADVERYLRDVANGHDDYQDQRREVRAALHNECDSYSERIVRYFGL